MRDWSSWERRAEVAGNERLEQLGMGARVAGHEGLEQLGMRGWSSWEWGRESERGVAEPA